MKIFLAEERNGQLQTEHGFDRPVIRVGREKSDCNIIFDHGSWSMVSRRHAELRLEGGRYVVADIGSSQGTFVDGQRVTGSTPVKPGSKIQFGTGGPVMKVVRIEQPAPPPPAPAPVNQPQPAPPPPPPAPSTGPAVELINSATGQLQRFPVSKDVVRLGRGSDVEVLVVADAAVVSRRHAEIRKQNGRFVLHDLNSFNGTFYNRRRVVTPVPLFDGDMIQLGTGGPICLFRDPAHPAINTQSPAPLPTIVIGGQGAAPQQPAPGSHLELLQTYKFTGKTQLTIGRSPKSDIKLDGLQISNEHARLSLERGMVFIEDVGSTNGVYINGALISTKSLLRQPDVVQIGPFLIEVDPKQGVALYDTRSKMNIDVLGVTKIVPNQSGGGTIKLLDGVDLSIQPNEFVGLLGPSGAGKSTLMDALNGMRPATGGQVLVNRLDLYKYLDSLKQSIGYVPQDDIIHRELTVYRTLYYVAKLRLSGDASDQDIEQIVAEVLDVTGLSERRDVPVAQLSGGQRKRVSIAVELITKPSVIFLDEPTSGLDPATEEKIMKLFRQIAESGRTVILTTHAMENVKLFDKVVVLMRGKLVFYGPPQEALTHVKASSFKDLYDKLEEPIAARISKLPPLPSTATPEQQKARKTQREQIVEDVAEDWKRRFTQTEQHRKYIKTPLAGIQGQPAPSTPPKRRRSVADSVRQWKTLSRRYLEVLGRDKLTLLILFGQAPVIALLTCLAVDEKSPRDFPYFVLALVAVWFGTSISAREIIRERAIYNRERMVNLKLLPYVGSKLFVLSLVVGLQCTLLFASLKLLSAVGLLELPGKLYGLPQLGIMALTSAVGIALGLLISALVKTSEMATSLVPLILIPQILFSGLVGVPKGVSRVAGAAMPATWSFDGMKRLAALPVLRGKDADAEETSEPEGHGLYKRIERKNDNNIANARQKLNAYKADAQKELDDFKRKIDRMGLSGGEPVKPTAPTLKDPPKVENADQIPQNLSGYVDFLHPWGGAWRDAGILLLMFVGLIIATIMTLRFQDIG